jgi:NADH-quinone oxidoreductase subunit G
MALSSSVITPADQWLSVLNGVASEIAQAKGVSAPITVAISDQAKTIAQSLLGGENKAVLLGNAAAHADNAESLLSVCHFIAQHTGASVGYLTEAANTVGAQLVGAMPKAGGQNASQMLSGANPGLQAALLLNTEPEFDSRWGADASARLAGLKMVVGLTSFKTNLDCCDVLLPIAPFTETSGSFVNAEGRLQSFHAVVKPLGDTRPAWKVLRVLATLLGLDAGRFESSSEVLAAALPGLANGDVVAAQHLSNATTQGTLEDAPAGSIPCTASIYQLDGLVRRATSLQLTADAKRAAKEGQVTA